MLSEPIPLQQALSSRTPFQMPAPFDMEQRGPTAEISYSSLNATGTFLVTAHADSSVTLWKRSALSWEVAATIPNQNSTITDICFSPDKNVNTFATCTDDGIATIYNFASGMKAEISTIVSLRDADKLAATAFSDRGQLVTLGGGQLRIYGKKWGLMTVLDVEGRDVSFAPGGKALIAGGTIFRCKEVDFEWVFFTRIGNSDSVISVDWGREGLIGVGRKDSVEILELQSGVPEVIARFRESDVKNVRWDPIGGILTSEHNDGSSKRYARDGATWEWRPRESKQSAIDMMA